MTKTKTQKKINTKPFELVGFTYEEYLEWCEQNSKKPKEVKSKKEFFRQIYNFELVKIKGKMTAVNKED